MSKRPAKRQKTARVFAAPTADDDPNRTVENNPSSSSLSTRDPFLESLPSLSTLCARVFVKNFRRLADEESGKWERTRHGLKELPDAIAMKLFTMLKAKLPHLLSHPIIATVCRIYCCSFRIHQIEKAASTSCEEILFTLTDHSVSRWKHCPQFLDSWVRSWRRWRLQMCRNSLIKPSHLW